METLDKALNKYLYQDEITSEDKFYAEPLFKNFISEFEKIVSLLEDKINEHESPVLQNKTNKIKNDIDKNFKALSDNLFQLKETLHKYSK